MDEDSVAYMHAVNELKMNPIQGPHGTYHVKNGIIYYGYKTIGMYGFSTSEHYWHIFH